MGGAKSKDEVPFCPTVEKPKQLDMFDAVKLIEEADEGLEPFLPKDLRNIVHDYGHRIPCQIAWISLENRMNDIMGDDADTRPHVLK